MAMNTKITVLLTIAILILSGSLSAANAQRKQQQKTRNLRAVKIYLVDSNRLDVPGNPGSLFAVTRRVDGREPLAAALQALTKGATAAEERRGWHDSTYGIQFVSVELKKDGSALARFTMPETATFGGTNSPLVFIEAVEKTVLQFAAVKKVTVCLDGAIDFRREDEIEPKKC
jgi:hypothetical protein